MLRALAVLLTLTGILSAASAQSLNIAYDKLSDCQHTRFATLTLPGFSPGQKTWDSALDDSQRLEYAGGTQALNTVDIQFPICKGLGELFTVKAILGSRPNQPSADQFNIQVAWLKDADKNFKSVQNWSGHISWLHPGQFGYQENRDGFPTLGIVVLFNKNQADVGQFHVGFRTFGHYGADNGNVGKNYKTYCRWYGEINGYLPCGTEAALDWTSVNKTEEHKPDLSQASLETVVREFLRVWYISQNMDDLFSFVAHDNAVNWSMSRGVLPKGIERTEWDRIFAQAFVEGPGTARFYGLENAIRVSRPSALELSDTKQQTVGELFTILPPTGIVARSYFPPDDLPDNQLDAAARFLNHLKHDYFSANSDQNRLSLVVFVNKGEGLIKEACVLYWIKEDDKWKLAAFQGTD
jgi:hypothetical protein